MITLYRLALVALLWCATIAHAAPVEIRVSPDGPVKTIRDAVDLAAKTTDAVTIIVHAGTYAGAKINAGTNDAPWLITAARADDGSYERVMIDGAATVASAEPIDAAQGVYRFPASFATRNEPSMWEADTRIRYKLLADERSVMAVPGSFTPVSGAVIFRTSDGKPPAEHDIGLARDHVGFFVTRPNVTLRGIQFRGFLRESGSSAVTLDGPNQTVEDCIAWNCDRMIGVGSSAVDSKVLNCTASDVATGVLAFGKRLTVEGCRFFRKNDSFVVLEFGQNLSGIQVYHPGEDAIIRRNVCVGFPLGIFIKAVPSPYVLEYNTVISSPSEDSESGIGCTQWHPDSVVRYNISVGFGWGFNPRMQATNKFEQNLIWHDAQPDLAREDVERIRQATGGESIAADPRFVDPAAGDYRLAPTSPAVAMGPGGTPIGAAGAIAADARDTFAPTVSLAAEAPARIYSGSVKTWTDPYHMVSDGGPTLISDEPLKVAEPLWATLDPSVTLRITAADSLSAVDHLQVRVGDADWQAVQTMQDRLTLELPRDVPNVAVQVKVRDAAGNWSAPATLRVLLAVEEPRLAAAPTIYTNTHGAAVLFSTNVPCFATLQWGRPGNLDQTEGPFARVAYDYNTDLAKQWEYVTLEPQTSHRFTITPPSKGLGNDIGYRVVLTDAAGRQSVAHEGTLTTQGPARTLHVATNGRNDEAGGSAESPLQTIQFAVDRALPGDRVLVAPGVYIEEIYLAHGGVEGAPLVIESAEPWGAVLDAAGSIRRVVSVRDTAHVQVKGFEIRWVRLLRGSGVFIYNTQHVTVTGCKLWYRHWSKGRPNATGVYANRSSHVTIDHCVFFAMNEAFRIAAVDNYRITHNTAASVLHRIGSILNSSHGYLRNNSFAFGENYALTYYMSAEQLTTVDSDYNNFKQYVRSSGQSALAPEEMPDPIAGDFFAHSESKALMVTKNKSYHGLKSWQEFSGLDKHSIYVHPRYADPHNRDFRLLPDSPNIGAGENGATIGALGVRDTP